MLGNEGRHSASRSSATLIGSLELAGERAKLVVEITTRVHHVQCPADRRHWPQHQACHEKAPEHTGGTSKLELTGTAKRTGDRLAIDVSLTRQPNPARPPQRIAAKLACTFAGDSLACVPITDSRFDFLGNVRKLELHRPRVEPVQRAPMHAAIDRSRY